MTSRDCDVYDLAAVERWRQRLKIDPEQIRGFRNSLLKHFRPDSVAWKHLPSEIPLRCHTLQLYQRHDSEIDGATKLLFQTEDRLLLESVILRIESGRNTVCISSQVGCAAACDFCATGRMGIARDLSPSQILDQVVQVGQILAAEKRRLSNIVFMGMGEPFHNEGHLVEAVSLLTSPQMLARAPRNILVSTVGVPDAMLRFAQRFPDIGMALSLHSAKEETRNKLIPLGVRYPLGELKQTARELNVIQKRPLMIEYLMLADRTDSEEDAMSLLSWLQGLRTRVNLIPYNPIAEAPHLKGSDATTVNRFAEQLRSAGHETTIRYSLGADIAAACGQLVRLMNERGIPQASQVAANQKMRRQGKI